MPAPTSISVEGLSKSYHSNPVGTDTLGGAIGKSLSKLWQHSPLAPPQKTYALQDIHFQVTQGDILGIIGHNGAGKSTLLKILAGITPPTTGQVKFRGRRTSILEIGTGFHPDLTGRQNVHLAAAVAGISAKTIKQRFHDIVDFSGIPHAIDMPVKQYSSGMYLRLAFSVAFFTDVEILLLDEILSVGDVDFRVRSTEKIREIAASGATIVLASHELQAVKDLCTHCLLLDHGRIALQGSPRDVIDHYLGHFFQRQYETAAQDTTTQVAEIALRDITIRAAAKTPEDPIHRADPVIIDIRYTQRIDHIPLNLAIRISTFEAILINDSPVYRQDYQPALDPAGNYTARVTIPALLLNAGTYYLHLFFGDDHSAYLSLPYVQKFKVHLSDWELGKRWNEDLTKAPLRPHLHWETIKEDHP